MMRPKDISTAPTNWPTNMSAICLGLTPYVRSIVFVCRRSTQPSIPSGVGKNRVPGCLAGVKAGRVHLCRVEGNAVCYYGFVLLLYGVLNNVCVYVLSVQNTREIIAIIFISELKLYKKNNRKTKSTNKNTQL